MDSSSRSNGSSRRPAAEVAVRGAPRSKLASRVERVVNTALAGERSATLNVTAAELLADSAPVAAAISSQLARPGVGLLGHWMVDDLFRRSKVHDDLLDALHSPDAPTRAAAARLCGAARFADALVWLGDLVEDPDPEVRDAAIRSLARLGGRRAVDLLIASADSIPLYRLAIALSAAASDIDIEALMRQPVSEHAAVATVMACGLRRDALRIPPLLGIAHDRRWPVRVRLAACRAMAIIGSRSAADGLARLAQTDPDPALQKAADLAHRRLVRRAVGRTR